MTEPSTSRSSVRSDGPADLVLQGGRVMTMDAVRRGAESSP